MAMYFHSDVSSYESSSDEDEAGINSLYGDEEDLNIKQVVLPLECFYKKVLFDLLISRNDSFFNYCFDQIFSRKIQATINGDSVSYNQLRLHFLSLRRAYYDAHHHAHQSHHHSPSSSFSSSSSSSISTLPHAASPFAPDGSVLKFGPFLANSTNGGREGYLAAHTILANLINNSKWDSSPLLSAAQLSPEVEAQEEDDQENQTQYISKKNGGLPTSNPDNSTDSIDSDEPECDEKESETSQSQQSPRKRRYRNHHHSSSSSSNSINRIRYNALVVTDTMEIQWMEGKDGECRKITKFERIIKRPGTSPSSSSSSSALGSSKNVKQRRC